ncbi:DUF4832 domain-containing protein [Agriterribacter sp.]|uniref:DUF4832 domain-containing protein n=1 Tax=Agriterribacter sp. TaxID=2821509 RepID=UPI002BAEBCC5|nr:DUF4832 domain-containing protein [Agriterribacter sp.]HRP57374.1 DUF4832 domain-containing protein [Agriterribacter sp.]
MMFTNKVYKIISGIVLLCCFLGCKRTEAGDDPGGDSIKYEISNAVFPNPERGFIKTMSVYAGGASLNADQLGILRNQNISMILRVYYLDAFKDRAISNAGLSLIQEDMDKIRNAGLKVILRFAYTDDMEGTDAPYAVIEQHLDQLKPVFEHNKDVIAFMQAGFIGAWGEWHSSSNGLATIENEKKVLTKILSVLPPEIMVQVRTPAVKQQIFGNTAPVTAAIAYSSDSRARVGHHNDCFLSGGTDYGTYNNIEAEKKYISDEALFVPTGGETCPPTGGYDPTCAEGRKEMKLLKWTYLNLDWYPATINAWKASGCFDEFQTYLGYRLALTDAKFPQEAAAGSSIPVSINITNKGYAPLYNKKNAFLILKSKATGEYYEKLLAADLRACKPAGTLAVNETVSIAGIPAGDYDLSLRIADQADNLKLRKEYSVRLANANVWTDDNNGMNNLNQQLTIKN